MAKLKINFSQNPDVYIKKQARIRNQRPRIYKVHNHLFLNFFKVENLLHCVIGHRVCCSLQHQAYDTKINKHSNEKKKKKLHECAKLAQNMLFFFIKR